MTKATSTDNAADKPEKKAGALIPAMIMAVLAGGASFGAAYMMTKAPVASVSACKADAPTHLAEGSEQVDMTYIDLDEILITIGSTPATRYLKMRLAIATSKEGVSSIEKAKPLLTDAFLTYLRSIEMADFERPTFYSQMRDQLSRRANLVLGPSVSDGVLITEFLLR